jgi:hypothetical protein
LNRVLASALPGNNYLGGFPIRTHQNEHSVRRFTG